MRKLGVSLEIVVCSVKVDYANLENKDLSIVQNLFACATKVDL